MVVRAFNHLDAAAIATDGTPAGTSNRRALGYAGDDPGAKGLTADLYEEFGFDAVDVGGLADAWRLDVDQPTFVVRQNADELRANLLKAAGASAEVNEVACRLVRAPRAGPRDARGRRHARCSPRPG